MKYLELTGELAFSLVQVTHSDHFRRRPSSSRVSSSRKKSRKSKINYDDEIADPQNNMYSDDERKVIVFHPHSFPEGFSAYIWGTIGDHQAGLK